MNTNWSQPKTNIFSAMLSLRKALMSGNKATLIKIFNEECAHPIRSNGKDVDLDFREYTFSSGTRNSVNSIKSKASTFCEKLSLDYICCFGTAEAIDLYYNQGILSSDNFNGIGRAHLINVDDAIKFFNESGNRNRVETYYSQYRNPDNFNKQYFFDNFRLKNDNKSNKPKHFKRKVWAVALLNDNDVKPNTPILIHVINVIMYPLKFIPNKSVLRMPDYTLYTFRIGGVVNGYNVQFQIPKKFSFK